MRTVPTQILTLHPGHMNMQEGLYTMWNISDILDTWKLMQVAFIPGCPWLSATDCTSQNRPNLVGHLHVGKIGLTFFCALLSLEFAEVQEVSEKYHHQWVHCLVFCLTQLMTVTIHSYTFTVFYKPTSYLLPMHDILNIVFASLYVLFM